MSFISLQYIRSGSLTHKTNLNVHILSYLLCEHVPVPEVNLVNCWILSRVKPDNAKLAITSQVLLYQKD